jgi:hypothetical protein
MKLYVTKVNASLLQQIVKKNQKLKTANETLTCMTADTHGNFPDRQCLANQENDASNPQHA